MSSQKKSKDAEDILSEFQDSVKSKSEPEPKLEAPEPEPKLEAPEPEPKLEAPEPEPKLEAPEPEPKLEAPEPEPKLEAPEPEPKLEAPEPEPKLEAPEPEPKLEAPEPTQTTPEPATEAATETRSETKLQERDVIFIGTKPIMTYVSATLTQLASRDTVTIKARGKRITQAVDVSQMIVKRMDTVGYTISDVRISSDSLTSQDGKQRNVSTMEIDISKKQN